MVSNHRCVLILEQDGTKKEPCAAPSSFRRMGKCQTCPTSAWPVDVRPGSQVRMLASPSSQNCLGEDGVKYHQQRKHAATWDPSSNFQNVPFAFSCWLIDIQRSEYLKFKFLACHILEFFKNQFYNLITHTRQVVSISDTTYNCEQCSHLSDELLQSTTSFNPNITSFLWLRTLDDSIIVTYDCYFVSLIVFCFCCFLGVFL